MKSKITTILLFGTLIILSCKTKTNSVITNNKDSTVAKQDTQSKFKTLNEVKMALLSEPLEKAIILLGTPNKKGTVSFGATPKSNAYMVYFNKVRDNGTIKNLILIIDSGYSPVSNGSPIIRIDALLNGEVAHGVTNQFTDLTISQSSIKCNCGMFTVGDGTIDWSTLE